MRDQGGIRKHVAQKDVMEKVVMEKGMTGKEVIGKEVMAGQEKMDHHPRAWSVSGLPSDTTMV
jgi:hypothetical protein